MVQSALKNSKKPELKAAELLRMGSISILSSITSHRVPKISGNLLILRFYYTILVIPVALEETVCAKVPAELKKKLSSLGVNVSEVIRETLQSEVDRLERERINKLAKEVSAILKKIPPEEFAQSIRATRNNQ